MIFLLCTAAIWLGPSPLRLSPGLGLWCWQSCCISSWCPRVSSTSNRTVVASQLVRSLVAIEQVVWLRKYSRHIWRRFQTGADITTDISVRVVLSVCRSNAGHDVQVHRISRYAARSRLTPLLTHDFLRFIELQSTDFPCEVHEHPHTLTVTLHLNLTSYYFTNAVLFVLLKTFADFYQLTRH